MLGGFSDGYFTYESMFKINNSQTFLLIFNYDPQRLGFFVLVLAECLVTNPLIQYDGKSYALRLNVDLLKI